MKSLVNRSIIFLSTLLVLGGSVSTTMAQAPVQCGNSSKADIIVMFDVTGSISSDDLDNQALGMMDLLDNLEPGLERPRFAFGSFNVSQVPGNSARMGMTAFTNDYSVLRAVIDRANPSSFLPDPWEAGSGRTDISAAIKVAREFFASPTTANDPTAPDYLLFISDGQTNIPAVGACSLSCGCPSAETPAKDEAALIKAAGVTVFAIHFDSMITCPVGPDAGQIAGTTLMRDFIATSPTPEHYLFGNGDLTEVFQQINTIIACNDTLDCTVDSCDTSSGFCVFTEQDADSDGVLDCQDLCSGDDSLIGDACDGGDDDNFACGAFSCESVQGDDEQTSSSRIVCNDSPEIDLDSDKDGTPDCAEACDLDPLKTAEGQCGCGNPDVDTDGDGAADCVDIRCTDLDISKTQLALDGNSQQAADLVQRIVSLQKRLAGRKGAAQRKQILTQAKDLANANWTLIWSIPSIQTACDSNSLCVSVSNVGVLSTFNTNAGSLRALAAQAVNLARAAGLSSRAGVRLLGQADRLLKESNDLSATVPSTNTSCTK